MRQTVKGVTIADLDEFLDAQLDGVEKPIDPDTAKGAVPLLRLGQDKRAGAVQGVPFEILDGENDVSEKPRFAGLPGLIKKTELSLCAYGKAYWSKTRNSGGFVWPEWFAPSTIDLEVEKSRWTGRFERKVGAEQKLLTVKEVLYFWEPDEDVETGPGQAPMDTALYAASVLLNADKTLYNYYMRGGVPIQLFEVPMSTLDEEVKKLKAWWQRLSSGVKSAFASVFVKANGVKPIQVGANVTDAWNVEIINKAEEAICHALQVHPSLLLSNQANYAEAETARIGWYMDFVFPRCQWLADQINEQWLEPEGLKMVYHPELTEIWQTAQLAQGDKVAPLFTAGIIDRKQALELLGFAADDSTEEETPEPEEEAPETPDDTAEKVLLADIEKWERYARKRYAEAHAEKALQFKSDAIPPTLQASIRGALSAAHDVESVDAIFKTARTWADYGFIPAR